MYEPHIDIDIFINVTRQIYIRARARLFFSFHIDIKSHFIGRRLGRKCTKVRHKAANRHGRIGSTGEGRGEKLPIMYSNASASRCRAREKEDRDSIKRISDVGYASQARRGIDFIFQRNPRATPLPLPAKFIGRISSSDLITLTIIDTWMRARARARVLSRDYI